jgi:hypothetical protein
VYVVRRSSDLMPTDYWPNSEINIPNAVNRGIYERVCVCVCVCVCCNTAT